VQVLQDLFYVLLHVLFYCDRSLSPAVYHPRSEGGIDFSSVCLRLCLYVCLSVNTISPEPLETSSQTFSGHYPMVERADKFENAYTGVRGGDLTSLMLY